MNEVLLKNKLLLEKIICLVLNVSVERTVRGRAGEDESRPGELPRSSDDPHQEAGGLRPSVRCLRPQTLCHVQTRRQESDEGGLFKSFPSSIIIFGMIAEEN